MTSKAKAIEALKKLLNDEMREPHELPLLNVSELLDLFKIIKDELSQPTLDDAIKVVEAINNKWSDVNLKRDYWDYDHKYVLELALEDILTALKGLKERK